MAGGHVSLVESGSSWFSCWLDAYWQLDVIPKDALITKTFASSAHTHTYIYNINRLFIDLFIYLDSCEMLRGCSCVFVKLFRLRILRWAAQAWELERSHNSYIHDHDGWKWYYLFGSHHNISQLDFATTIPTSKKEHLEGETRGRTTFNHKPEGTMQWASYRSTKDKIRLNNHAHSCLGNYKSAERTNKLREIVDIQAPGRKGQHLRHGFFEHHGSVGAWSMHHGRSVGAVWHFLLDQLLPTKTPPNRP